MASLDFCIGLIFLWALFKGLRSGFFGQLASIGGTILGFVLARMLYAVFGDYLCEAWGHSSATVYVLAFIFIWVGVPMALSVLAYLFTKVAEQLALGGVNRAGGALLAVIKYGLVLSFLFCLLARFQWIGSASAQTESQFAPILIETGETMFRFLGIK